MGRPEGSSHPPRAIERRQPPANTTIRPSREQRWRRGKTIPSARYNKAGAAGTLDCVRSSAFTKLTEAKLSARKRFGNKIIPIRIIEGAGQNSRTPGRDASPRRPGVPAGRPYLAKNSVLRPIIETLVPRRKGLPNPLANRGREHSGGGARHCHSVKRRSTVAQASEPAVSPVSKPARRTTSYPQPIWKSAIQQVWKPALRFSAALTGWQWSPRPGLTESRCASGGLGDAPVLWRFSFKILSHTRPSIKSN